MRLVEEMSRILENSSRISEVQRKDGDHDRVCSYGCEQGQQAYLALGLGYSTFLPCSPDGGFDEEPLMLDWRASSSLESDMNCAMRRI